MIVDIFESIFLGFVNVDRRMCIFLNFLSSFRTFIIENLARALCKFAIQYNNAFDLSIELSCVSSRDLRVDADLRQRLLAALPSFHRIAPPLLAALCIVCVL